MSAPADPVPDPVDEELAHLLAHPVVQERLADFEHRLTAGELDLVSQAEVRRHLGLPVDTSEPPSPAI
jgi:hypothetical protein